MRVGDTGCRMPDARCQMIEDAGCHMPDDTGCQMPDAEFLS